MPASSHSVLQAHSTIRGIMDRHGVRCSPEEFHQAVNVLFHNFESEVYDSAHRDMWASLPRQFDLLAGIGSSATRPRPGNTLAGYRVRDGFGIRLPPENPYGGRIKTMDLLDTSPSMLSQASRRAAGWKTPSVFHQGLLNAIPPGKQFELIVTCSVLHHVPDLPDFLGAAPGLQPSGGVFLHLQDPNGDFLADPVLRQRMTQAPGGHFPEWASRFTPGRVFGRIYRELTANRGRTICPRRTAR